MLTIRNNTAGEADFKLFPLLWFQTVDCLGSNERIPEVTLQTFHI
jgi:hypothetical protein